METERTNAADLDWVGRWLGASDELRPRSWVRVWVCECVCVNACARVCESMCVFVATEHLSSNRPYSLKQQPPDSTLSYGSELWASLVKQQLPRIMNFLDLKIILCQN